jgi:hypothetical protein
MLHAASVSAAVSDRSSWITGYAEVIPVHSTAQLLRAADAQPQRRALLRILPMTLFTSRRAFPLSN